MIAAILSADSPTFSSAVFLALLFAQFCLIGKWAGLSRWFPFWFRIPLALLGTALMMIEMGLGIGEFEFELFLLCAIPTTLLFCVASIIRPFASFRWMPHGHQVVDEGLRFTIVHLLILTTEVCLLLSIGRILEPYFEHARVTAEVTILGVCFSAIGIASLWATLGIHASILRAFVVCLIAASAGWIARLVMPHHPLFWLGTTAAQAIVLITSRLFIRKTGYRLVSRNSLVSNS